VAQHAASVLAMQRGGAHVLTQHEWTMLLIATWRADKRIIAAIHLAAGVVERRRLTTTELQEVLADITRLRPNLVGCYRLTMPVRVFLARFAAGAAEALYAGDEKLAAKRMTRPQQEPRVFKTAKFDSTDGNAYERHKNKLLYESVGGRREIKFRERDKKHDWKTVK
jgi:hypothetical protein